MRVVTLMLCSEGSMGSGIIYFPEDLQRSVNPQSIPGKGYTYKFATFPFVFLNGLTCLLGLQDLPKLPNVLCGSSLLRR